MTELLNQFSNCKHHNERSLRAVKIVVMITVNTPPEGRGAAKMGGGEKCQSPSTMRFQRCGLGFVFDKYLIVLFFSLKLTKHTEVVRGWSLPCEVGRVPLPGSVGTKGGGRRGHLKKSNKNKLKKVKVLKSESREGVGAVI